MSNTQQTMPEQFKGIMMDFINDLNTTFPEYSNKWWVYGSETTNEGWEDLYKYCLTVYPERFFDILYQSDELFSENSTSNTYFLPNVDFKLLYNCEGVTETTRQSIWNYLKLLLFTMMGGVKDKSMFGDSMNMFEGVDENELQEKLSEVMSGMSDFMKDMEEKINKASDEDQESAESSEDGTKKEERKKFFENMNPDDVHGHIKSLFGEKLGGLANELVEEFMAEIQELLGINPENFDQNASASDLLKKLMRHPDKFMKLTKKIGEKFHKKMESGDISKEDIAKEMGDIVEKMRQMGGSAKQMNEMFKNMAKNMGGMGGMDMGKNMRVDTNRIDRMMKTQNIKDRLRNRLKQKEEMGAQNFLTESTSPTTTVFRPENAEIQEKSYLADAPIDDIVRAIEGDDAVVPEKKTKNKKSKKSKKK